MHGRAELLITKFQGFCIIFWVRKIFVYFQTKEAFWSTQRNVHGIQDKCTKALIGKPEVKTPFEDTGIGEQIG